MEKLLVKEYLKAGGTLETLAKEHGVYGTAYNGKVSFAYDQIEAKESDPLACQCRGLVLRENTWEALAVPFFRFFNQGQGHAAKVNWETAKFESKLDGSLTIGFYCEISDRWYSASRQMSEGQGEINKIARFSDIADKAAQNNKAKSFDDLMKSRGANKRYTYCFELTSPYNQIVCEYKEAGLTLLGVRDLDTLQELHPENEANKLSINVPKTWSVNDLEHLMEIMKNWNPKEHEGVVVKDHEFKRVKVKTPQYVLAHHYSTNIGISWKNICEAVVQGYADDVESMVPEFVKERFEVVRSGLAELIEKAERDYDGIKDIENIKEFAEHAKLMDWSSALFAVKRGKAKSVKEFAKRMTSDSLVDLISKIRPDIRKPIL